MVLKCLAWNSAQAKAASLSNYIYVWSIRRIRKILWADTVPRCLHKRRTRAKNKTNRGTRPSENSDFHFLWLAVSGLLMKCPSRSGSVIGGRGGGNKWEEAVEGPPKLPLPLPSVPFRIHLEAHHKTQAPPTTIPHSYQTPHTPPNGHKGRCPTSPFHPRTHTHIHIHR